MKQRLYAIKSPSGVLLWDTAASTKVRAWDTAYQRHLYRSYSSYANPTRTAHRYGWRCVPVKIEEEA